MLNFCDFIQVIVFTTNQDLKKTVNNTADQLQLKIHGIRDLSRGQTSVIRRHGLYILEGSK